ncbi:hypothetical protein [Marmoricola sp. RAF53]|uniref:hypothetical protein n=1 Tax=Marmoricola sp. RAF53 TaxID=3233059 RepID=UPI003F979CF9
MTTDTATEHVSDVTTPAQGSRTKVWIAVALAGVLVGLGIAWFVVAHREDAAPYTDPAARGTLTFCDADGHEVTGGSVKGQLADTVVGSSPATGAYAQAGNATLFAYQPREGVSPEEFSGLQLTAASAVDDAAHPSARITARSTTLADFVAGFPAAWHGYVQLRLLLTAPGTAPQVDRYDAADLRVDGDRWRLVTGGGGACATAHSNSKGTS